MTVYKPKSEDLSSFDKFGESLEIGDRTKIDIFKSDTESSNSSVTRTEVLDFGDEGFLLHQVMSADESQYYIDQGEKIGFHPIPGVKKTYRSSDRYYRCFICKYTYRIELFKVTTTPCRLVIVG